MLEHQINMPKVLQKRLWKEIIKQKICNQSLCLKEFKHEGYQRVSNMINEVQSGDKNHVESKAAAVYFNFLFGQDFHRREDSLINNSLNYCYAIVRGHIARSIVCHGFEPSIGLNHKSQLNSFNLADDFIEPYRAIVDYYVVNCLQECNIEDVLDTELKHNLINIVQQDVLINEGKYTVSKSIDMMIGSFNSVICNKRENLLLPQLLPMSNHNYE